MKPSDQARAITSEDILKLLNLKDIKDVKKYKQDINELKEKTGNTLTLLNNFILVTTNDLQELHNQVDGVIDTWFFNGVPTLENEPAVNWTTDTLKRRHLGDYYYDQSTGLAYRFSLIDGVYKWNLIGDSAVSQALAIANAAKDTADSKRRVFVNQPTVPYDIGDLWIKDDLSLYRCQIAEPADGSYNPVDWIVATKYTDDTVANNALAVANEITQEVHENYATTASLNTAIGEVNATVTGLTTRVTTAENTLGEVAGTVTEVNSEVSQLKINAESIQTTVSSQTETINELGETIEEIKSTFQEQTDDAIITWFKNSGIENTLQNLQDQISENGNNISEYQSYIAQKSDTTGTYLEIGKSDNSVKVRLYPDKLSFYENGAEVAYISNNSLYITESTILTTQRIGHWETKEDLYGNLNTKWIGGSE